MRVIVTGGAGFIGSALVRFLVRKEGLQVCCIDNLAYSGNLANLATVSGQGNYQFERADICDENEMRRIIGDFKPDALIHLAAESHVDRSIDEPGIFVRTNVVGTYSLLKAAREYCGSRPDFRFVHVSTDEVFGSLGKTGRFNEESPYRPSSPYSATKAAADHLARAWFETYDLPVIITNCSNNFGPFQFPEKLIPLVILKALQKEPVPVYGDGQHVRDWLYVEDHVDGLCKVLESGRPGMTYNIGGNCEKTNLDVVTSILKIVGQLTNENNENMQSLICHVADRPGHDQRYAIDATRIRSELGWESTIGFDEGLFRTVQWYLDNSPWCEEQARVYTGNRLGTETNI